jgi:hypothetical protein
VWQSFLSFERVWHIGKITEVIPKRKGFLYSIAYEDGGTEDMDDRECQCALELHYKKESVEPLQLDDDARSDCCGQSD